MIIEIEGTDGCGKQTQTKKLFEKLKGLNFDVQSVSFPNYNSEGCGAVKMYLNGAFGDDAIKIDAYQASSFFMVDRLTTMLQMKKENYENNILICDRYVESNLIHQASKLEECEQDEFVNWLMETEYGKLKLPKPNLVIFLNMPPKLSLKLASERKELKVGGNKDIHENNALYLAKCYETGMKFAKKLGWNIIDCSSDGIIKSVEEIHEEVLKVVLDKLNEIEFERE